jgi:hypothetical protein
LEDRDDIPSLLEVSSLKKENETNLQLLPALPSGKQLIIASKRKNFDAKPRDEAIFILRSVDCFSVRCNMLREKNEVRVNTNFSSQFDTLRRYDMNGRSNMKGGKN